MDARVNCHLLLCLRAIPDLFVFRRLLAICAAGCWRCTASALPHNLFICHLLGLFERADYQCSALHGCHDEPFTNLSLDFSYRPITCRLWHVSYSYLTFPGFSKPQAPYLQYQASSCSTYRQPGPISDDTSTSRRARYVRLLVGNRDSLSAYSGPVILPNRLVMSTHP